MQQYWQTLNNILDSVNALQKDKDNSIESPEIKESAKSFETSLRPCLQELSESSARLTSLLENSFKELQQAEDIWLSKNRIANADTSNVWQEITKLTGYYLKINQLGNESKKSATNKAKIACKKIFNQLLKIHFSDPKQGIKPGISWGDKTKFNKAIKPKLDIYDEQLNNILSEELISLFEFFRIFDLDYLFSHYSLLDKNNHKKYLRKTKLILNKINHEINHPDYIDNVLILKLSASFDATLNDWQKRFGDIYWQEVSTLEKQVINTSTSRVKMVIDDRVKLASSIIEEMITFYSQLLEKQNRYRQETPQQRLAEKHWIDKQKETLGKVQADISCILENNNEFLNQS